VLVVLGLFTVMSVVALSVTPRQNPQFPTAAPARYEPGNAPARSQSATYEQSIVVADAYGSQWQAQALLDLMTAKPNGSVYRILATSPAGESVTLVVDNATGTLSRRHVDKAGKSSLETWQGEVQTRVRNTAAGGTFNDASPHR
jgi:hypothetical protein